MLDGGVRGGGGGGDVHKVGGCEEGSDCWTEGGIHLEEGCDESLGRQREVAFEDEVRVDAFLKD